MANRITARLKQLLALILLTAVVGWSAWLSSNHRYQWDWTAGARNSLSLSSQVLLERLDNPVIITAYTSNTLRQRIQESLARYRRYKPDLTVRFVDPESVPDELRRLGITTDGELRIEYEGRAEHVPQHTEQAITNALHRVARSGERWIVFVTGHGERDLLGRANHDLGMFGDSLEQRGYLIQPITLTEVREIPANTALLVIAGPRVALLDEEAKTLEAFLDRGGNLLWLAEPGPLNGLKGLADRLGLRFGPGQIVDPTTPMFGVTESTFPVVSRYPPHPVTAKFNLITLFPESVAVTAQSNDEWRSTAIITTSEKAWSETTKPYVQGEFEAETDQPGPLSLGLAMEPASDDVVTGQRIVVIGDGDFLSNAYLGNGGNLDLGFNIINWLSHNDELIALPAKIAPDLSFSLSKTGAIILAIGSLFVAPALLFGTGIMIWWKRR